MNINSEAQYGEEDQSAVDKEWEEFSKLVEIRKKRQEQAFYPCPPPEDDEVNNLVRLWTKIKDIYTLLHKSRIPESRLPSYCQT